MEKLRRIVLASVLLAAGWVGLYAAAEMRAQDVRLPRLGDCIHFVNYIEPLVGQEQAALVTRVNEGGSVNLLYFTGNPADPENPPPMVEFKFNRHRAWPAMPNHWHYCDEHAE